MRQADRKAPDRRPPAAPVARRAASSALAVVTSLVLVAAGTVDVANAGAASDPVPPRKAPAVVEGFTPYLPQVSCDPTVKPGTAALRATLLSTYGGRDLGVVRACTIGARSEHKEGRAFDWGLNAANPAERAVAHRFLKWLTARGPGGGRGYNARRLGVMYVIWNRQIWSAYRAAEGWRAYTGGESHTDHIHISLAWNGAMKHTSWWTGKAAAVDYGPCQRYLGMWAHRYSGPRASPCPSPVSVMTLTGTPVLRRGSAGPYVLQLQRLLKVSPLTGYFGPITDGTLRGFQLKHQLTVSGKTSKGTWSALRGGTGGTTPPGSRYPARLNHTVKAGQTLSGIAAYWRSSVRAIKSVNRLRRNTIRPKQVLVVPVRSWLTRYSHTVLRKGSRGGAVTALQKALQMPHKWRTGYFWTRTRSYVNVVKRQSGWHADGIAGSRVWRKLGA